MGARLVAKRHNHRIAAAAWDYQIREHKALGFGSSVAVFRGDGTFVGWMSKRQFVALAQEGHRRDEARGAARHPT